MLLLPLRYSRCASGGGGGDAVILVSFIYVRLLMVCRSPLSSSLGFIFIS